jgi:hypothetical protein
MELALRQTQVQDFLSREQEKGAGVGAFPGQFPSI